MQYTPHYNLNLPEGTDIVNPLVQANPNYSAIDAAMYANKLRVIGTASEIASGSVHAITRADTDIPVFRFVATADYNTGDTFTVDGVSVTARRADGATMKNKAYVINSTVLAILDGTILNFIGIDGTIDAGDVVYDNTSSGLNATDTEGAINELAGTVTHYEATSNQVGSVVDFCVMGHMCFGKLYLNKSTNSWDIFDSAQILPTPKYTAEGAGNTLYAIGRTANGSNIGVNTNGHMQVQDYTSDTYTTVICFAYPI